MKFILTENQSYDATELQAAFNLAGVQAFIVESGQDHIIIGGDTVNADPIVQIHINEMTQAARVLWKADQEFNATIKQELCEIDLASVRSLREYIASKVDAPQVLKDHEADAILKRGELNP